MALKVLLTGFTPFPGAPENPTAVLVEQIQSGDYQAPQGVDLTAILLPTEYERSVTNLTEALAATKPDVLLEFGLSAKAEGFTLEETARNEMIARQADNTGMRGDDGPINPDGPATRPTGLPVQDLLTSLRAADLPATLSQDAGGYVCNHLFYRTMCLSDEVRPLRAGFIHIPYLAEQRDRLAAEGRIGQGLAALTEDELHLGLSLILAGLSAV